MRICNLYADRDGETHFRDIAIALTEKGPDGCDLSHDAGRLVFRLAPGDQATIRRNLDAPHQIQASDGERRIIGAGEIYLVEDVCGKGHLSRGLGQFHRSLLLPID